MTSINEFQNLLSEYIPSFIQKSQQIGGLVETQSKLAAMAFDRQLEFIQNASLNARPSSDAQLIEMLKPMSCLISQTQILCEQNRHHNQFNHLSAIAQGIGAVGWVTVSSTPAPYIKEMSDSAQFYTNKILVMFRPKGQEGEPHIEWAKTWIAFLGALQAYVRKHHTTGLVWASGSSSGAQGLAPPPPPPPPSIMSPSGDQAFGCEKAIADARAALFASINQGEDITKMLKKVSTQDMTHKNLALRNASVPGACSGVIHAQAKNVAKVPEKFVLDGKKWLVENFTGKKDLFIQSEDMSQSVIVYKCDDCILQIKGKVNSVIVDQCKKFSIVFDSIVSAVEFINSKKIQAQAMAIVPTVTMDSVEDIELYLSKDSLGVEIVSSKSTAINISIPGPSGDYVEHPIPEQLKSTWNGHGFQTVAVDKNA